MCNVLAGVLLSKSPARDPFFISRVSGADIGLPLYPRLSVLGRQNLRFTPVPVITDWNHSGGRHP